MFFPAGDHENGHCWGRMRYTGCLTQSGDPLCARFGQHPNLDFYSSLSSCEIKRNMSQTHPLTTTTFELPGYRVAKSLGVVRGVAVRSRSILGTLGAHIQTLFGGHISLYSELCERTRTDAFNLMLAHAGQLGANAVIGVRYDATEIAPGVTEVLCYGTAVYVEPEKR